MNVESREMASSPRGMEVPSTGTAVATRDFDGFSVSEP